MTAQLPQGAAPVPAATEAPRARRGLRRRDLLVDAGVLVAFVVAGAVGGLVWHALWDAPRGAVQDRQWLYLDNSQLNGLFSGTALYAVVGFVGAGVLAVVTALLVRGHELVTLAAVTVGSVLAAVLAYRVGVAANPVSPVVLAYVVPEGTELPGLLRVSGHTPFVAWPFGALVGLGVTYLFTSGASAGMREARRVELPATAPVDDSRPD